MAFCALNPSLELLPTVDRIITFSHSVVSIKPEHTDQSCQVSISRDVYTQLDVDELQKSTTEETNAGFNLKDRIKYSKIHFLDHCEYILPFIVAVRKYKFRQYILGDILSGISVACLHFPQGLAYGILASLSPVHGLYTSFFPVLFYVLFGTVQHMAIGTDSIVAIIVSEIVETESEKHFSVKANQSHINMTSPTEREMLQYKTTVAMTTTFLCGCILVTMGIFRLGFLTTYQSKSFIGGFTTAAAFHIFTSQVPKALGITVPLVKGMGKMVYLYKAIIENILQTNTVSIIVVAICVVFIMFIKDFINVRYREKMKTSIPADLLAIILATVVSKLGDLHGRFDIEVVGDIPGGIPVPSVPSLQTFKGIYAQSFEMSLLIFFLSIAMVKVCAEKHEYEVNDNHELIAYGLTNIGCSFFPCFPPSTSPPRNMILSSMGARTTLNGIFTALVMVLVIVVLGGLFESLPVPALAAMIFVSVKPLLLQVTNLRKLFRINKFDFLIWIVSCLTGILMDLPYGLLFGIGTSVLTVIVQSQTLKPLLLFYHSDHQMFVSKESEGYIDHLEMRNIKICRINTSIYFATSDRLRKTLYNTTLNPLLVPHTSSDVSIKYSPDLTRITSLDSTMFEFENKLLVDRTPHGVKIIILDCSCVSYIDLQGVNTLSVVFEEYRRVGVTVLLAGCTKCMWDTLRRSDFFNVVSMEKVFYELEDAFNAAKLLLKRG